MARSGLKVINSIASQLQNSRQSQVQGVHAATVMLDADAEKVYNVDLSSVEVVKVAVVQFEDGKIASERVHRDQASALVQLGLLKPDKLPVAGVATAKKVLDPKLPSNELMKRSRKDKDL